MPPESTAPVTPGTRSAPRHLRALLAGLMMLPLLAGAPPAHAHLQELHFSNHTDGTPDFNSTDGPGLDSGPRNLIVRTHDFFEYSLAFSSDNADRDVRISLTLPPSASSLPPSRWSFLPRECGSGSAISADGQQLSCLLGDLSASGTRSLYFRAEVLGSAANNTVLQPPAVRMSSAETADLRSVTQPLPLRVSAAPFYDVVVLPLAQQRAGPREGSGPHGEDGFFHRYNIGLMARNPHGGARHHFGRKGIEMLDPAAPIEIDLDISQLPDSVRLDNWRQPGPASDRNAVTGSFGDGCGSLNQGRPSMLSGGQLSFYGRIRDTGPLAPGAADRPYSVANGGDCQVMASSRQQVRLHLTGTDTSLQHTPSRLPGTNRDVPADEFWVANKALLLWTSMDSYPLGQEIQHPLRLQAVRGRSISGQALTGNNPANDLARYGLTNSAAGDVVKAFEADASLPPPWRTVRDQTIRSSNRVNQMASRQTVSAYLAFANRGTTPLRNIALCEIIDRTAFDIGQNFQVRLGGNHLQNRTIRYGAHRNGSPYFASTDSAPSAYEGRLPQERSPQGDSAYSRARCNDPGIDWFDTPAQAQAAGGLVYVRVDQTALPISREIHMIVQGLILRSTWAATIQVQAPRAEVRAAGQPIADGTIIRNRADVLSDTLPELYRNPGLRDHLSVISAQTQTRITKEVTRPATAAQQIPVPAGTTLSYRLTGRYSTHLPPMPGTVTITDVLPASLRYQAGSSMIGTIAQEPQVQPDTPAPGLTTLTWTLSGRTPHLGGVTEPAAALPAIRFRARASFSLADGSIIRNEAAISGGKHDIEPDCHYDPAQNGFGACPKASAIDIPVQSPPGFFLEKSAARALIEPGDPIDYSVSFVSIGTELRPPEIPDVIDVLPFVGDGVDNPALNFSARAPASHFGPGAYRLDAVTPPADDPQASVFYTRHPPGQIHHDPQHHSNRIPGGSTRWCLHSELGSAGCPASIAEASAVRIRPGIRMLQPGQPYDIAIRLLSDPVLAWPGSIFANRASSRPADPAARLLFVESQSGTRVQVSMTMSSLSGRVFVDTNQNNHLDPGDWALPGQCISIAGTSVKQHKVLFSMRTDAAGAYDFAEGVSQRIYQSADCSGTPLSRFPGLMAGQYTLSRPSTSDDSQATQPGRNHAGSSGGRPGAARIEAISLAAATRATAYHFTSTPTLPRLSLSASISNQHGGTASAGELSLLARNTADPEQAPPVLSGRSGSSALDQAPVPPGSYRPGHQPLPGYRAGAWQCTLNRQPVSPDTLLLNYGDTAHCRIHFEDLPARLTLEKKLDIQHGRSARPGDFMLHAEGQGQGLPSRAGLSGADSVTATRLPAGAYALREDNRPGFLPGPWLCRLLRADGSEAPAPMQGSVVTLGNGEHAHCSITNTDVPLRVALEQVSTAGDPGPGTGAGSEVKLFVTPVGRPGQRIPLKPGEAASTQLVPGEEYELSVSQAPGYETRLFCRDASQQAVPLRLVLGAQNIGCQVVRKRIPTTARLSKTLLEPARLLSGRTNEYTLAYQITVQHDGGAAGHYDLLDIPGFDADVDIIGSQTYFNDQPLADAARPGQPWVLARQRPLAMGETHRYRIDFRLRVPFGSQTANNRCNSRGAGHGLFNQARLSIRHDVDNPAGSSSPPTSQQAHACTDTPEPPVSSSLSIDKSSAVRSATTGELVSYRLRIRNTGEGPAIAPVVVDRLPAGFRFEPGSLRVQGARHTQVQLSGPRELRIRLDRIEPAGQGPSGARAEVSITYRLRLGVGAQEGDGINRAHVECLSPNGASTTTCSNESRWKVRVQPGIFSEQACLAGQVFVDCNGNSLKDSEEAGIPGVRLYLQNGTWLISDAHGKYSFCGLRPRTHVLKVDTRTLPRGSRMVTSSAQNTGDALSLFIDARKGMLHRADFIEGSCSPRVIEQVKARQAQGASHAAQTEPGQPALRFESKSGPRARPHQQGTDPASQPVRSTRH